MAVTQSDYRDRHRSSGKSTSGMLGGVDAETKAVIRAINKNVGLLEEKADKRFDRLEAKVDGLAEDVSGLKDDVSGLKDDVSGLKDDVSGLKDDVKAIREHLEGQD